MSFRADVKTIYHLALGPIRGETHAERMEHFYGRQARHYDNFRQRFLLGRRELYSSLNPPENGLWADLGAGTGANLEAVGDGLAAACKVYLVDVAPSLLQVARERIAARQWNNVETVEADATVWQPPEGRLDLVTFSYSLTMIPDWFAILDHAVNLLKPGGRIGVVDFFVSRKHVETGGARHSAITRSFWPAWFATNNVMISADHVPYLHRRFEVEHYSEHRAKVPYVPLIRVPYYRFVGRKPV